MSARNLYPTNFYYPLFSPPHTPPPPPPPHPTKKSTRASQLYVNQPIAMQCGLIWKWNKMSPVNGLWWKVWTAIISTFSQTELRCCFSCPIVILTIPQVDVVAQFPFSSCWLPRRIDLSQRPIDIVSTAKLLTLFPTVRTVRPSNRIDTTSLSTSRKSKRFRPTCTPRPCFVRYYGSTLIAFLFFLTQLI